MNGLLLVVKESTVASVVVGCCAAVGVVFCVEVGGVVVGIAVRTP